MGSPDDEPGRYQQEGPVHEVTIGEGFWLFDTPCRQDLWYLIMGSKPSRFVSLDRPVESVSFDAKTVRLEAKPLPPDTTVPGAPAATPPAKVKEGSIEGSGTDEPVQRNETRERKRKKSKKRKKRGRR